MIVTARYAQLVAHVSEKQAFGAVCGFGSFPGMGYVFHRPVLWQPYLPAPLRADYKEVPPEYLW